MSVAKPSGLRLEPAPLPRVDWQADPIQDQLITGSPAADRRRVLGAPGTGKTSVIERRVQYLLTEAALAPQEVLVISADRTAASELQDRIGLRSGVAMREPIVTTFQSLGLRVLRAHHARTSLQPNAFDEESPRLLSGPEQQTILADMLAGHVMGLGRPPAWPEHLQEALTAKGFLPELRDIINVALVRGATPTQLRQASQAVGRPQWAAVADVLQEYLELAGLSGSMAFDPAVLVVEAARVVAADAHTASELFGQVRCCYVDDAHELTADAAALVRELAALIPQLWLVGDPDAATLTFRGADPEFLGADGLLGSSERVWLPTRWRYGPSVCAAAQAVSDNIGVQGAAVQRRATSSDDGPDSIVTVIELPSTHHEAAHVADVLHEAAMVHQVDYQDMAVIVRSAAQIPQLIRRLSLHGVPCDGHVSQVPLKDNVAVAMILDVISAANQAHVDRIVLWRLLNSPAGDTDARGLQRQLRGLAIDADVDPEQILWDALRGSDPHQLCVNQALQQAIAAACDHASDVPGGVWAIWSHLGLAEQWRHLALQGGVSGQIADQQLDAVIALLDAAGRYSQRLRSSTLAAFADHIRSLSLATDTLAKRGTGSAVRVLTPSQARGLEFDTVVVAGVQEGTWPNTALRGSILAVPELADYLDGRPITPGSWSVLRQRVISDELRMFLVAITRARRQLVVTAVQDATQDSSPVMSLISSDGLVTTPQAIPTARSELLTVAALRTVLGSDDEAKANAAAADLARLAADGVRGSDPKWWWPHDEVSCTGAAFDPQRPVTMSPSKLESLMNCPLQWFWRSHGLSKQGTQAARLGTLVHEVAAEHPKGTTDQLLGELEKRWASMQLPDTWWATQVYDSARSMVTKWAQYVATQPDGHIDVEREVHAVVDGVRIVGRADRVVTTADGSWTVVDLKTARAAMPANDALTNVQLGAYQVAMQHVTGRPGDGATLVYVGTSTHVAAQRHQPPLADAEDPQWMTAVLQAAERTARGAAIPTQPEPQQCRVCDLKPACPAHQGHSGDVDE